MEIWKDLDGYDAKYQISNLGNVKRLEYTSMNKGYEYKHKEKLLKQTIDKKLYKKVVLRKDGQSISKFVHRLVAEAFIPNPQNKPIVDHIIPLSMGGTNEASNLRWCTMEENMNNELTQQNMQKHKSTMALYRYWCK